MTMDLNYLKKSWLQNIFKDMTNFKSIKTQNHFYKSNKKITIFRFIKTLLLIFLEDGMTEITNVAKVLVFIKVILSKILEINFH